MAQVITTQEMCHKFNLKTYFILQNGLLQQTNRNF